MHDARAVFHRHIIAGYYTESPFSGVDPRDKLLVMHAGEVAALIARHHFVRHGIKKEDIGTKISVDDYNAACRAEVMKYTREWTELTNK